MQEYGTFELNLDFQQIFIIKQFFKIHKYKKVDKVGEVASN